MIGDVAVGEDVALKCGSVALERSDVPAGGEGGSAAVYGLDSTPAEGA